MLMDESRPFEIKLRMSETHTNSSKCKEQVNLICKYDDCKYDCKYDDCKYDDLRHKLFRQQPLRQQSTGLYSCVFVYLIESVLCFQIIILLSVLNEVLDTNFFEVRGINVRSVI